MRMVTRFRLFVLSVVAIIFSSCTITTDPFAPTTDVTSSTSGKTWFTEEGIVRDQYKLTAFATLNFQNLKQDMAQGRGEYLTSMGMLMGVPRDHQTEFFALTQQKYSLLVRSDRTTPSEMLAALSQELSGYPILSQGRIHN
jgi:hypothetical protein